MECPLCQNDNSEVIRTKLRHNISRRVFRCRDCSLVFLEPKSEDTQDYYGHEYRKTYSPVIGKALDSQEIFDIYFPYQEARIKRLEHILRPDMRVLDIGCSAGHFMQALKDRVGECIGLEYNTENVEFIKSKLGFKAYSTPIEETDLPLEHFDLITAFQMFEHVEKPLEFLNSMAKYLKNDGYLCIETTSVEDALLSVYEIEEYADFWYREPHVFNYSPKTLRSMLEKAGFSGEVSTIQRINFLNHMNWAMNRAPQKGADIHMAAPKIFKKIDSRIKEELNNLIQKTDKEYRDILTRYDKGESVLFIGQKIADRQSS